MTKVTGIGSTNRSASGMDQRSRDKAATENKQGDGTMDSQATDLTYPLKGDGSPTRLQERQHPERASARAQVAKALGSGRLAKPLFCMRCFLPRKVEAHHADYNKPLAVSWLCRPCHTYVHPKTQLNVGKKPTFQWAMQATHADMADAMRLARAS